jgi:hypothetical protein
VLAQWADSTLFWAAMAYNLSPRRPLPCLPARRRAAKAFAADRGAMSAGMTRLRPGDATAAYKSYLRRLANMLEEQDFLLGAAPTVADFAAYHPLWFSRVRNPVMGDILQATPAVLAWMDRPPRSAMAASRSSIRPRRLPWPPPASRWPWPTSPSRTSTASPWAAVSASPPSRLAPRPPRASWWRPPACTTRCGAAMRGPAPSMCISGAHRGYVLRALDAA